MTKISAVVPDELAGALERQARANERSLSGEVRRALRVYLDESQASPSTGSRGPDGQARTLSSSAVRLAGEGDEP